jgi:DNA-binding HxlR family transcriptional regulator
MESYAQFCPIAKASEVITRRWSLLVIRELLCGSNRFNEIHRGVPKMSRTLLAKRLGELEEAGLVERSNRNGDYPEYVLTRAGEELRPIVQQLGRWGKQWTGAEISDDDVDAGLLMWDVQRRIDRDELPSRRVVVAFQFPDAPPEHRNFWLLLEKDTVDLCLKDPGFEEDLYVCSDVKSFTKIWLGDIGFDRALRDESISLSGPRELRRQFPRWFELGMFAHVAREREK